MENTNEWFEALLRAHDNRNDARQTAYQQLSDHGFLPKATLHRYHCPRHCVVAVVFRAGGATLCATRDYKLSPRLNEAESVPAAREKNTLDGNRWWPSHVFDVDEVARWGEGTGIHVTCRHYRGLLSGEQILKDVGNALPGRPGKPTTLRHSG